MSRPMGAVYVRVRILGPAASVDMDRVLVDTGAIHTMVERSLAERLGIRPEAEGVFRIVGGRTHLSLGTVVVEIEGRSFRVPVILGDQNLIGLTTLETLGFAVDPVEGRLVDQPGVLYAILPKATA